jgi:hypothetical protein
LPLFIKGPLKEGWGLFAFAFWGFTLGFWAFGLLKGKTAERKRIFEGKMLKRG